MPDKETEDNELDSYVVADMSGVEKPGLAEIFFGHGPQLLRERRSLKRQVSETPREPLNLTKEETRWYALGALKAGLLVGLVYAAGLGLVILIMLLVFSLH